MVGIPCLAYPSCPNSCPTVAPRALGKAGLITILLFGPPRCWPRVVPDRPGVVLRISPRRISRIGMNSPPSCNSPASSTGPRPPLFLARIASRIKPNCCGLNEPASQLAKEKSLFLLSAVIESFHELALTLYPTLISGESLLLELVHISSV